MVLRADVGRSLRVLAVEPFYTGSHRQFLDQWRDHSRHTFDLVTFPGRHWKWRMRHSALSAAREIEALEAEAQAGSGDQWDVLFASSMLPLAELRGLSRAASRLPAVLYFHENQLTYPVRAASGKSGKEQAVRDAHFAYSNFLSCCAADQIWFNSGFHRKAWLRALPEFLARFPDFAEVHWVERIAARSQVQWPGVIGPPQREERNRVFEITWAARWEHDKNPEDMFRALSLLARQSPEAAWRVNILGESFRRVPECFAVGEVNLGERIGEWGFLPREQYEKVLSRTDVFIATAHHEFFGLSVAEAMTAGARPLLPDRLAYPELVEHDRRYLYDGTPEGLARKLRSLIAFHQANCSSSGPASEVRSEGRSAGWPVYGDRFLWRVRAALLDEALCRSAGSCELPFD